MLKTGNVGANKDEPDFSVMSFRERKSTVTADGHVLLKATRKGSAIDEPLKSTKIMLLGNERVPFMGLYQVQHLASRPNIRRILLHLTACDAVVKNLALRS